MTTATFSHPSSGQLVATVRQLLGNMFSAREAFKPRPLTRFEEAAALRTMANGVASSDHAFAQDLYAAADRHELA